jgi:hypothetical protein
MDRIPHLIRKCAKQLGLTPAEALAIAATAPKRYFVWEIDKRSGGKRIVCHPARELKPLQHYFLHEVLHELPVHSSATAYVKGSSIKRNAQEHVASRVILKLDFVDFFNSLKVSNWQTYAAVHFSNWSSEEVEFSSRILFWGARSYSPKCLAVGAPTSPHLSNALMFDVDEKLHAYAAHSGLVYTRYADDITFSAQAEIDRAAVIKTVEQTLAQARYTRVRLNEDKTKLVSNGFHRRVTGLVLTPDRKVSLGRDRKRLISAMCHHQLHMKLAPIERPRLAGLLAFAQDIEPSFVQMLRKKYSTEMIDWLLKQSASSME